VGSVLPMNRLSELAPLTGPLASTVKPMEPPLVL
jgi:hypothetical protein